VEVGEKPQPKKVPGGFDEEVEDEDDNMDIDEKEISQVHSQQEMRGRNQHAVGEQNQSPSKSDIYYDSKGRQRKRSNSSKLSS
jgi:hypothetical protein